MMNKPHSNLHEIVTNHLPLRKNNGNKNNKNISIKMEEDVGASKPKKHANKVWEINVGPKIKQTVII